MTHRIFLVPLLSALLAALPGISETPRTVWLHEAKSNLYVPPLAADVCPTPGQEILVADSEARRLRCISAAGEPLWESEVHWKKRLISPPALSAPNDQGERLIAIANGDGSLACLRASDGALVWRTEIGAVEWGGALWADLEGNGKEAVVVGTESNGVYAFDQAGTQLWHADAAVADPPLKIRGPLAAGDVEGDGPCEIFGASAFGVFCLNNMGALCWQRNTGDDYPGGPVFTAEDTNGSSGLYCVSKDDAFLWCFSSKTGEPLWKAPLHAAVDTYSASSIAIGDIVGSQDNEIVLGDSQGNLYAFDCRGQLLWSFQTLKATHIAATLGDVNGDGSVDVLAASGDHFLYCLDNQGRLQWTHETGKRLIYPPTLADLEGQGMVDILLCGCDRTLRRLSAGGRYSDQGLPWPMRRGNAGQRGEGRIPPTMMIWRHELAPLYGDFEQGKVRMELEQFDETSPFYQEIMSRPRGWRKTSMGTESWGISKDRAVSGESSLKIEKNTTVESEPWDFPSGMESVSASVHVWGKRLDWGSTNVQAALQWIGDSGVLREDRFLYGGNGTTDGWILMVLNPRKPPAGAQKLVMSLNAINEPAYCDCAEVRVVYMHRNTCTVLTNQAGYDTDAPKRFMVQANFESTSGTFRIVDGEGRKVMTGNLVPEGRIKGYYGQDWGYFYYSGDFSSLEEPGSYFIHTTLGSLNESSRPVEIGEGQLWKKTAEPAFRFFYYQRCGMEIPGYHGACHLDDATGPDGTGQYDLWGGWHDAGDYNKYHNAPYAYGLAVAYGERRNDFDALGDAPSGFSLCLDELLWGADHVRRMVREDGSAFGSITSGYGFWGPPELETDNLPGTGDERPGSRVSGDVPDAHHAALARMAVLLGDREAMGVPAEAWVQTAERSLAWALKEGRRGLFQLSTALDLHVATGKEEHRSCAETLAGEVFPAVTKDTVTAMHLETARRCDAACGTSHFSSLRTAATGKGAYMLECARNPFGVYTFGPPEHPNFFGTPADKGGWRVGTNSHLMEGAYFMALAFLLEPDPRFLRFIQDQFNWVLGMNPYNISLMEGVGAAFAPSYHHRYTFSGVDRGAVPGGVVNGITWRSVGDDSPSFDMTGLDVPAFASNEVWLPHNTFFLEALAFTRTAVEKAVARD